MTSFVQSRPRALLASCLVAFAVLALPSAGEAQPTNIKIGVVNLDYIVAQSPAGKALQSKLQSFQQQVRAELEIKTGFARDLRGQIADGASSLTQEKLNELQKKYEDAGIEIKRYQDDKEREGQKMQAEGLREVEKELEPVFEAIRDEGGYDLILNNVPGVIVMVGERIEITQQVIERLQAAAGN